MSVYNGERYLQESIDSILTQTFENFELLIINDGSTDNTRNIILSYNNPRIRLVNNESNLGLTQSLNKGLELAQGEFIARQDGDDISEPERLAKQVAFLETHSEVALVGSWYKEIDSQGRLIGECSLPCDSTRIRWEILFYCPFVHSAVMFRKHIIAEQIGFYNEAFSYAQDYDLWWRITRNLKVANLKEYLMKLRINPLSMTATYGNIVDDEPLQIKLNNIGHLLGWNEVKQWDDTVDIKAITSLWLGELEKLKELNRKQFNTTIEQILRIHHDFCQYYKLEQQECKQHRQEIVIQLSNQLLILVNYFVVQDRLTAWWLFIEAYRLNFSILLTKKALVLFIKLLTNSWLIQEIRRLNQKNFKLEQK